MGCKNHPFSTGDNWIQPVGHAPVGWSHDAMSFRQQAKQISVIFGSQFLVSIISVI